MLTPEQERELRADLESGQRLRPVPIGAMLPLLATIDQLRARLAALEPGTLEACMDAVFEFAEKECGHSSTSSRHALTGIQEYIDQLRAELQAVVGIIQKMQPSGSPPPGGAMMLVEWIVSEALAENARLQEQLSKQKTWVNQAEEAEREAWGKVKAWEESTEALAAENARLRERLEAAEGVLNQVAFTDQDVTWCRLHTRAYLAKDAATEKGKTP